MPDQRTEAPRIRIAPTPSGYLHLGNAVNMRLIALVAERDRLPLVLRIDDIDGGRVREEYIADIFAMLEWLDIQPDIGPASIAELERTWTQGNRMPAYRQAAEELRRAERAYVCACTRTDWAGWTGPGCPRGCRGLDLETGRTLLRWRGGAADDTVVWRREGIPAYHLASIVDDDLLGITHVIRGADLEASTRLQRALAGDLPGSAFPRARVHHHPLVTDAAGRKLAKSAGALRGPIVRDAATLGDVDARAGALLDRVTWMPEC